MAEIPIPQEALDAAERFRDVLRLMLPQGFDVGVGVKETGGEMTDVLSLRVYVYEKRPLEEVPERERIPEEFEGFPVDVIESRTYLIADTARYDPLRGGIEISRPSVPLGTIGIITNPGTLGALVRRAEPPEIFLLTCEHVAHAPPTNTHQPGAGSSGTEVVGTVAQANRDVDCAIIKPNGRRGLMSTVEGIGPVTGAGAPPAANQAVKKRGRTTLLTHGAVGGVVPRQNPATGQRWRVFDIAPTPAGSVFCNFGDSGSAVLNAADQAVGLLFAMDVDTAGNPVRGWAVVMEDVLTVLSVDIAVNVNVPGTTPPAPPTFPGRLLRYPPLTTGADVEMWQTRMVERGWTLDIDGKYGSASKAACRELQTQKGLDPDGIVGELTWDATFAQD